MRARIPTTTRVALITGAAALVGCGLLVLLIAGWAMRFTASAQESCAPTPNAALDTGRVPAALVPLFQHAAARYELGAGGPAILAALTKVESDFGRDLSTSSAGAVGWTQFLPSTWRQYGVDADGDGRADPNNAADAIFAAAKYLGASGAPADWRRALLTYNHAAWYVDRVLRIARELMRASGALMTDAAAAGACAAIDAPALSGGVQRVVGGGRIVAIPGQPGELIDERILPDVLWIIQTFRARVTDGYATTGHAADGEHPLGLGVDLVPGPGGSWEDIDRLAQLAEPTQNQPRPPWRWVGYNGDTGHGRGHHLHLSWQHGPGRPGNRPPAAWVLTLARGSG